MASKKVHLGKANPIDVKLENIPLGTDALSQRIMGGVSYISAVGSPCFQLLQIMAVKYFVNNHQSLISSFRFCKSQCRVAGLLCYTKTVHRFPPAEC